MYTTLTLLLIVSGALADDIDIACCPLWKNITRISHTWIYSNFTDCWFSEDYSASCGYVRYYGMDPWVGPINSPEDRDFGCPPAEKMVAKYCPYDEVIWPGYCCPNLLKSLDVELKEYVKDPGESLAFTCKYTGHIQCKYIPHGNVANIVYDSSSPGCPEKAQRLIGSYCP